VRHRRSTGSCAPSRPSRRRWLATDGVVLQERLVTAARPENLTAVHAALDRFWRRVAARGIALDDELRFELATAVGEVAGNVVRHAYPAGPGELRMALRLRAGAVEAVLTDRGVPFPGLGPGSDLRAVDPLELSDGGFGLDLVQAAVDRVDYARARGVNRWRLVKQIRPAASPGEEAVDGLG
jgi:serine/threonine-protein kinase RsbW